LETFVIVWKGKKEKRKKKKKIQTQKKLFEMIKKIFLQHFLQGKKKINDPLKNLVNLLNYPLQFLIY